MNAHTTWPGRVLQTSSVAQAFLEGGPDLKHLAQLVRLLWPFFKPSGRTDATRFHTILVVRHLPRFAVLLRNGHGWENAGMLQQ
jgi:hypothetical protein